MVIRVLIASVVCDWKENTVFIYHNLDFAAIEMLVWITDVLVFFDIKLFYLSKSPFYGGRFHKF
jgi:hypothetical protein